MASAAVIMQRPDPVNGRPENFDALEDTFIGINGSVKELSSELESIRFGRDDAQFRGEAADCFAENIAAIDNELDDLGDVCEQIARIFRDHATRLRGLQAEADSALARAKTSWHAREAAEQDVNQANRNIDYFQRQLDCLTDEDNGVQRYRLECEIDRQEDIRRQAYQAETRAERALEAERDRWQQLQVEEDNLAEETASRLLGVNLESLADPSFLEQVLSGVLQLGDLVLDSLQWIYDRLDTIIKVLTVVVADHRRGPARSSAREVAPRVSFLLAADAPHSSRATIARGCRYSSSPSQCRARRQSGRNRVGETLGAMPSTLSAR